MSLQKQVLNISFHEGVDKKSDPLQIASSRFLALENSVFNTLGRLTKRDGFLDLTTISDTTVASLATFNNSLIGVGNTLSIYDSTQLAWKQRPDASQGIGIDAVPISRGAYAQTVATSAVSTNGNICTVYTENSISYIQLTGGFGAYTVSKTALPSTAQNVRVVEYQSYFVIFYTRLVSATPHLEFVKVPNNFSSSISSAVTVSASMASTTAAYSVVSTNYYLYIFYSASTDTKINFINHQFSLGVPTTIAGVGIASSISACADTSSSLPILWASFYTGTSVKVIQFDNNAQLNTAVSITATSVSDIVAMTSVAKSGNLTLFAQQATTVIGSIREDDILQYTATATSSSLTAGPSILGVGLYSEAFYNKNVICLLTSYYSAYDGTTKSGTQPTYFLYNSKAQLLGKLAYSNAASYLPDTLRTLSNVTTINDLAYLAYLYTSSVQSVNKSQGAPANDGILSIAGTNMVTIDFAPQRATVESSAALNLTGGQMFMFDGFNTVEQGFHLYPEYIQLSTATTGGLITAQAYYYQITYEWTDAAGNLHRSSPSIPITVTTTGATSANTLIIPTLKQTTKQSVRIVIYRWSAAQQAYYQITSITAPLVNNPLVATVTYTDTQADSAILGNNILYTTGGVVENIASPACSALTLYKSRLFLVDAEDRNLIWYSKQIIEATPVEMSDLFTIYVNPTIGSQASTGHITALSIMDDKLIIFKENAIYYLAGTGPDNTGANNDFSDPIFVTSSVGCTNQASIVTTPNGLMFQSNKGIWLLGRNLATQYIGAPVESYNNLNVNGAVMVPATNQVRFSTADGVMLVYDYFVNQWSTFNTLRIASSIIAQDKHTLLDIYGRISQESATTYSDSSIPVQMKFTTAWLNLAGLQGFERIYQLTLTGMYKSPHKLQIDIAYDYNPSSVQTIIISPDNYAAPWGVDSIYGNSEAWGGPDQLEQWRIFPARQKCQAVQITVSELFDPSIVTTSGAGLTISGLSISYGIKKLNSTQAAKNSVG